MGLLWVHPSSFWPICPNSFIPQTLLHSTVEKNTFINCLLIMRDKERLITSPSSSSPSPSSSSIDSSLWRRSGSSYSYKFNYRPWALAAILLLALCSMFACSITLKQRTAGTLYLSSDDIESALRDDLDVLEVEEREKVVRHMWDVYTNSKTSSNPGLPKFWQEAFEAAYGYLVSDDAGVRNFAISEIAKMSMMISNDLDTTSSTGSQSQSAGGGISIGYETRGKNKKWNSSKAGT